MLSGADLRVAANELEIVIAPQHASRRSNAIAALCTELNRTETCVPGSSLRLRYRGMRVPEP